LKLGSGIQLTYSNLITDFSQLGSVIVTISSTLISNLVS